MYPYPIWKSLSIHPHGSSRLTSLTTDAAVNRESIFRSPDTRAALVSLPLCLVFADESGNGAVGERWSLWRFSPLLVDERGLAHSVKLEKIHICFLL